MRSFALLSGLAFTLSAIPTARAIHIERLAEEGYEASTVESNRKIALPAEVEKYLFANRKGAYTDGFIVLRDGEIVYERYARGFTRGTKHPIYSAAKTLSVLMMGIAEKDGRIDLDAPLAKYFPALAETKRGLTLRHFVTMTSGLAFSEKDVLKFKEPNVISLLYGANSGHVGRFMLDLPVRAAPGELLDYSSGDTNVLWWALKQTMPKAEYDAFPFARFFDRLDASDVVFEQDEAGSFLGSTFMYMRPIDLAKVGQLILNRGVFRGKRIVDEAFIDFMKTPSPGTPREEHDPYGGGLWLNTNGENYAGIDTDMLQAHGFDGQSFTVFPSRKMVVIRLADDSRLRFDWDKYMRLVREFR